MPSKMKYITNLPTCHFAVGRMRVDLIERAKSLCKVRGLTMNELANGAFEAHCNLLESAERRKRKEDQGETI